MKNISLTKIGVPVVVAAALALTGCSASGGTASGGGSNTAGDGGQKHVKIGFVTHVLGDPFIQQIIDGAKAAAKDNNVDLQVTGPAGGDANAQLQAIQNLVSSGVQGIATSVPGVSMASGLNQIVQDGTPVVQFNLLVSSVKAPYVGERATESGRILAQQVLSQIGKAGATGTVIVGNCFPGFPSLDERAKGALETLKSTAPGLTVLGPFDVKVAANENYAAWEALLAAHPDAKALMGLCAPDVTSLGKLQAANPSHKFVSAGYDLTAQNLAQIKAGNAYVSLGQSPFNQGYLPVKILADAIRNKIDLSKGGFIDAGTEIVTKDSVKEPHGLPSMTFDQLYANSTSPEKTRAYYQPLMDGFIKNWQQALEPIANESK